MPNTIDEKDCILSGDQYGNGIAVNEYNGSYSLVMVQQTDSGEIFMRWVYPAKGKQGPGEKVLPWKISIGESRADAVATLKLLINMVSGVEVSPDDDGLPF